MHFCTTAQLVRRLARGKRCYRPSLRKQNDHLRSFRWFIIMTGTVDTFFVRQDAAGSPVVLSEAKDACGSHEDRMDIL